MTAHDCKMKKETMNHLEFVPVFKICKSETNELHIAGKCKF